jgi:hypothetical protein
MMRLGWFASAVLAAALLASRGAALNDSPDRPYAFIDHDNVGIYDEVAPSWGVFRSQIMTQPPPKKPAPTAQHPSLLNIVQCQPRSPAGARPRSDACSPPAPLSLCLPPLSDTGRSALLGGLYPFIFPTKERFEQPNQKPKNSLCLPPKPRPTRTGHVPTVTNLRPQTFDLRLSLDTTGYAYAVVLPTTTTARGGGRQTYAIFFPHQIHSLATVVCGPNPDWNIWLVQPLESDCCSGSRD